MRIVDLKTFRELPVGTVFMKFEPCWFQDLSAKGETWEVDFLYESIADEIECDNSDEFADKLHSAAKDQNISLKMNFNMTTRDGCFDDTQLFAIYEKEDVIGLINKLKTCLTSYMKEVKT